MAHLYTFDKCDIACHAPGARRIAFVVYCSLEPAGLDSGNYGDQVWNWLLDDDAGLGGR